MVRNIQHDSLVPCAAFPKVEHCRCSYLFLYCSCNLLGYLSLFSTKIIVWKDLLWIGFASIWDICWTTQASER
jgi:hypothetical protein